MRVLLLGSGGREHALAWRLAADPSVEDLVAAPGNPGIAAVARVVPAAIDDPAAVLALAERERVDLTIVGPEAPLARGVADAFRAAGRPILGPSQAAAALESSKVFAKRFMARQGIPTARFVVCDTREAALEAVDRFGEPVVVKADGLAAGKGVVVAATRDEAVGAINAAMVERQFGDAGETLVVEECLTGPEISFFVLCDGSTAVPLGTAQDYKRALDDDRGPNTGGMGAVAPSPIATDELWTFVMDRVVSRVLDGMRAEGHQYVGFLYVSLMITPAGPQVIEFNVRFGDPEAQAIAPLLEGDFAAACLAAANGAGLASLAERPHACGMRHDGKAVAVVLASGGYPGAFERGKPIDGIDRASAIDNVLVFHAGTTTENGRLVTSGGRVLTVVGRGATYRLARDRAYAGLHAIHFDGAHRRADIGAAAVASASS